MSDFKITSPSFNNNELIPKKYSCDGEDVNPELIISGTPEDTTSLVLIVNDPDAPMGTWVHFVVWNIKPTESIEEDSVPGVVGLNDFGRRSWGGPCPPSGTHRYYFKLYALSEELSIDVNSQKKDVEKAMQGLIIAKTELVGLYEKS
ncbi:YbhB/YbcL family Raf kinase inhibitor-like protein [Candidatus Woesearchaeota archaeon]|nr:YbhB/YbcL family Raf kinase inhibitor-like protein [Candidatus Woesearchaeota archaeon]